MPPSWLVTQLHFNPQDTVVVLDDDSSIHGAWDVVFKKYQDVISVKHFTQGSEAVTFINSSSDKNKIFLLADFELLQQDLNGIDVIKQTGVRSILVTSHYANKEVLQLVKDNNIKLLPKQLAAEVAVTINASTTKEEINKNIIKASVVIIDDIKVYIDQISAYITRECKLEVDKYYDPKIFLEELSKHTGANIFTDFYPKTTKFFISNYFKDTIDGFMLAKTLHEAGFSKLYLLSGEVFNKGQIPEYLIAILKSDIDETVKRAGEP